ncbi:Mu transposase C-terminal domain-containing protein [Saccharophagus degradans]|uniref:Mu transposase C-terminal domain-containing protein n=1 Tax=Saccharophagus degradans TaxID=86304 RepID=UPI0000390E3F|nr:Mu transposase C-terminal domain-containing protein [Saccharophagus degradans]
MSNSAFLQIKTGSIVESGKSKYKITHILGVDTVLGENLNDKTVKKLRIDRLRRLTEAESGEALIETVDINEFSDDEWKVAQFRFECIRPLLDDPFRTRKKAESVAEEAGVHVATLYSWLRAYQNDGHLSSLIPQARGRKEGKTLIDPVLEEIIASAIDEFYLSKQRYTPADVIEEVKVMCRIAGVKPPHANTVRARIKKISEKEVLKRRGRRDKARDLFDPIKGPFPGDDFPLAVVQIDHTQANVIVVDEKTREELGRPWLTLSIDVWSRAILGVYVSMDAPSATAAGICIARSTLPKTEYLANLDVPGEWPMCGKMRAIHVDNAREFRGEMLRKSCQQYDMDLTLRPVKTPHYGAHIERYMGVASRLLHKLPGTTFSKPEDRKGYNSGKEAVMTLHEVEQHLVDFIVNVYHQRIHSSINVTPKRMWELGVLGDDDRPGVGLPDIPADPDRFVLDFLPYETRSVQNYGIQIDCINYYHEVLNRWINSKDPNDDRRKRKFTVRRDPRDISKIFFFDPDIKSYYVIPYRNTSFPPVSIWELREARRKLIEDGVKHVDEDLIFNALIRMKDRVDEAKKKTKLTKLKAHRNERAKKLSKVTSPSEIISVALPKPNDEKFFVQDQEESEDIFSMREEFFSDIRRK